MQAFRGRGKTNFQASHDLEDFVAVIEGRDIYFKRLQSLYESFGCLAKASKDLLAESRFLDVLPGFVLDLVPERR
jgi:hypothetical protein